MDWMRKVDVLEYWQGVTVASASSNFELPAVMCVKGYVQRPRKRNTTVISRRNIFIRDQYMCQCVPPSLFVAYGSNARIRSGGKVAGCADRSLVAIFS